MNKNKEKPRGFIWNKKRIFYVDPMGKDVSFERWRMHLFYEHHLAQTVFFNTEKEYEEFLEHFRPYVYSDYTEWRNEDE